MITIEGLCKSFDGKQVLCEVDLEVLEGETLAIIGRSGSGKSVLMKHMIGLLQPDEGRVMVDGTDINDIKYRDLRRLRQHFGVLFQNGALFDSLSAFDNVAFPLRQFSGRPDAEIRERTQECLELVQMPDVGPKMPSELSGGMRKRVALARAIALEPRYVFYDEPNSGLDPQTSDTINELIRALADRMQITSIVVTHDMHSVLAIADRAAFVHEGTLRWQGTVEELHDSDDEVLLRFVRANEYQIGRQQETALPFTSKP